MSFADRLRADMDIEPDENRAMFARRYAGLKSIGETTLGSWTQQIAHDASLLDTNSAEYKVLREWLHHLPAAMYEVTMSLKLTTLGIELPRREISTDKLVEAFQEYQDALVVLRKKLPGHDDRLPDIDAKKIAHEFVDDLLAGARLFDTKSKQVPGPGF